MAPVNITHHLHAHSSVSSRLTIVYRRVRTPFAVRHSSPNAHLHPVSYYRQRRQKKPTTTYRHTIRPTYHSMSALCIAACRRAYINSHTSSSPLDAATSPLSLSSSHPRHLYHPTSKDVSLPARCHYRRTRFRNQSSKTQIQIRTHTYVTEKLLSRRRDRCLLSSPRVVIISSFIGSRERPFRLPSPLVSVADTPHIDVIAAAKGNHAHLGSERKLSRNMMTRLQIAGTQSAPKF